MNKGKLITIILTLVIGLFILSGSIGVPLLFRGTYYSQIDSLKLVEKTGLSKEAIVEAYDEMMDYCMAGGEGHGYEFGTGSLKWTDWGKSHFDDVAKLFKLDITILEISVGLILAFLLFRLLFGKRVKPEPILGRGPLFWGPVVMLVSFLIVGGMAIIDFDSFFVRFHHIFFSGKDNWIFNPLEDEIINILPEELFKNFAILIVVLIVLISAISIMVDFRLGKREQREND